MPTPGVSPTDVTVPDPVPFAAEVTLPYASTVTTGLEYEPALTPLAARSRKIFPAETIGEPLTVNLALDVGRTATLVTVPVPPPFPPLVDEIVTFPFALLTTMLVPAMILVTPALVIVTVPLLVLAVTFIPTPEVYVLYGLAFANKISKLSCALVKAVNRESDPVDSLGNPTLIVCLPMIAIMCPYRVFISLG